MSKLIAPPAGLSPAVRRFWSEVTLTWSLSPEQLELLRVAVEARQRMFDCDAILRRDGLVTRTPRGGVRAHPAAKVRQGAESTFLQSMRAIGLEA